MPRLSRRSVLARSAHALPAVGARHAAAAGSGHAHEVTRTDAEWRDRRGDAYAAMREGSTTPPHSSDLADETAFGDHDCKSCDLILYDPR